MHTINLEGGFKVRARAVVVATGAQYRKLDVENYARFEYQGIHYAATAMEATLCQGQEVIVVGGGNSAGQAALFLSTAAEHVHVLIHGAWLSSTMSDYLVQRIQQSSKVTLHSHTEVQHLTGSSVLEAVTWRNSFDGSSEKRRVNNMFVMVGAKPSTDWLQGSLILHGKGFFVTGMSAGAEIESRYATSAKGVFAGWRCTGKLYQTCCVCRRRGLHRCFRYSYVSATFLNYKGARFTEGHFAQRRRYRKRQSLPSSSPALNQDSVLCSF